MKKSNVRAIYTNSFPDDKILNKTTGEIFDRPVKDIEEL